MNYSSCCGKNDTDLRSWLFKPTPACRIFKKTVTQNFFRQHKKTTTTTTTPHFAPPSFTFNLIAQLFSSPEQQKLVFPLILLPMLMEIGYEKSSHSGKSKWPSFPVMDPAAIKIMCNNKIRQRRERSVGPLSTQEDAAKFRKIASAATMLPVLHPNVALLAGSAHFRNMLW